MLKVLLVEDELLARSGMRSLIDWNANGFSLAGEASHGAEALALLEREQIDVVITDIRMPVMDGLQLIEEIRARKIPCEVIVLSSFDDFPYVRKAMTYGVQDYIHKPTMNLEEFTATLRRVAGTLAARRSAESYQRLILGAVEESREVLLKRVVHQALQRAPMDGKLRDLLRGIYVAEEPFRIGMLRLGSEALESPEKALRALVRELAPDPVRPVFLFDAGLDWLFLVPAESADWMPRFAALLTDRHGVEGLWEMAAQPCSMEQLAPVLQQVLGQLHARWEQRSKQRSLHPVVGRVLEYMTQHYHENLTLERLSALVHVSPVYLSRLFLKETGHTFIASLTRCRVEQAKRLLRETDLCAYEVGDRVGYGNSKYFLRVFKRQEGVTPGEFRERERKPLSR